jgi:hypothetical protein
MNKSLLQILFLFIFLTASCGQNPTLAVTTPVPVASSSTATPSPLPTATQTTLPTATPTATTPALASGASVTPLPTIPTFTPTFDARTIVTVTPAPKAECPKEDPTVVAGFVTPNSNGYYDLFTADDVLTYLNSGGALAPFITNHAEPVSDIILGTIVDLTGDGVSEVVVRGLVRYDILGCENGKYQNLFELATYDFSMDLEDILDLNKDRIPELIFYSFSRYGYANIYIVGWDGNRFRSLIDLGTDTLTGQIMDAVFATTYHKSIDTNGDGLREIVAVYNVKELCNGMRGLDFCNGTPTREQITVLSWNGQNYVDLKQENYAPPQYRFQAIQDGDWQTRYGNYARALSLYQEAIFNDRLEWWSPKRRDYDVHLRVSQYDTNPTVYPTPIFDNTEYPHLAAYAYYRIMLLHIVQGHESDAGTVYKTLQQKFSNDPHGHPNVEMATAFWEIYQSTHKMYDGCAVAIQYATEHPEILIPLGSDYHGSQSHIYVPADVCPFR